jgi:hypothetical protein
MNNPMAASVFWVNIPERDGWILVNVDGRKLGIIISATEGGNLYLRIAGFHLGRKHVCWRKAEYPVNQGGTDIGDSADGNAAKNSRSTSSRAARPAVGIFIILIAAPRYRM